MAARVLAVTLVGVSLLVAACGDDDDGEAPADDVYFGTVETQTATGGEPGLEVVRVEPNTPVSSSGLERGDVVTALDGEPVSDPAELSQMLEELPETHDAGDKVEITVARGPEQERLTVRLAANLYVGAQLLAPREGERGARVGGVPGGTPAAAAGLQRDDLITAVDGESVTGSNQLIQALAEHQPGDEVELEISRASQDLSVTLTLEPRG